MMTDTMVPSSKKKEKTSLVIVELLEEGQQPHRRHGAEPHRQDAQLAKEHKAKQAPIFDRRTLKLNGTVQQPFAFL